MLNTLLSLSGICTANKCISCPWMVFPMFTVCEHRSTASPNQRCRVRMVHYLHSNSMKYNRKRGVGAQSFTFDFRPLVHHHPPSPHPSDHSGVVLIDSCALCCQKQKNWANQSFVGGIKNEDTVFLYQSHKHGNKTCSHKMAKMWT